jgi:uncharacterized membrane protein YdjX (TVP38/TMEM64 family)
MMKEATTTSIDEASIYQDEESSTLTPDSIILKSLEIDINASGNHSPVRRREDKSTSATNGQEDALEYEEEYEKDSKARHQPTNPTNLSHIATSMNAAVRRAMQNPLVQKLLSLIVSILFVLLLKRLMKPSLLHEFLIWMENHPIKGLVAYLIIYPLHMVLILPGTPLCMGAGFVFKVQYGWLVGVSFCSIVTLFGSLLGSLLCFLLGRHCFRKAVRRWSKRYPIFDPIDHAVSENGFKIMALIYLTPAVPLGPMSYMMGTTSMDIFDFAKAKIAALPMTALYVYLGAATGTLMMEGDYMGGNSEGVAENGEKKGTLHKANMEELSLSPKLVAIGILFSLLSIAIISVKMKKELQKVSRFS